MSRAISSSGWSRRLLAILLIFAPYISPLIPSAAAQADESTTMACCRKGQPKHSCCRRKPANPAPALTAQSACGTDCCSQVAASPAPLLTTPVATTLELCAALMDSTWAGPVGSSAQQFDSTRWQRPPPLSS